MLETLRTDGAGPGGPAPSPRPRVPSVDAWRAAAWGGLLVVLYLVVVLLPTGRQADQWVLDALRVRVAPAEAARWLLSVISVPTAAFAWLSLVLWPALRHRRWSALGIREGFAVLAAVMSAEGLKLVLPHGIDGGLSLAWSGGGGFPSGHATLAAAFGLAWLGVVGPGTRQWLRGLLLGWVFLVMAATVPAGWHRPGEAVAGVVLAILWWQLLVGSSGSDDYRRPSPWFGRRAEAEVVGAETAQRNPVSVGHCGSSPPGPSIRRLPYLDGAGRR